ncbi:MAG: 23S rRNA (uracil(1939)-C(5))-methyltransferase RlmD [Coprobacillus sp.]
MVKSEVEIKKLGINGEGIGYIDKKICFINNALPGEIVEVEVIEENKKFLKGKVLQYIKPSPDRIDSFCKENEQCQGCSLIGMPYKQQLPLKKGILKDAFKKFSSFDVEALPIRTTLPSPLELGYRKVVSLPIAYYKGKLSAGIYQRESKYLTFMNGCSMQDPLINECLVKIENILNDKAVKSYSDKFKKGLRFMRVRNVEGQLQVLFVTGVDGISEEVTQEVEKIKEVKSIYFTINTTRYQDFELQGFSKIYGKSNMEFECFDQQYLYSVKSQFPVNPEMEKEKLNIMKSLITKPGDVLSLGCGVGILELALDNKVIAVDDKNYHIKDAQNNAKFLRKENVTFLCKGIDEAVVTQCKKNNFDVMVIRREELSQAIKKSLVLSKVKEVIYVCDHPSALAKDLEELKRYYDIERIVPIDTYPYTAKLEMIVKLTRK